MGRLLLLPIICWLISPGVETRETSFWAGLLYGLGMILDVVDGAIARRTNAVTMLGQFLDPLADKLFEEPTRLLGRDLVQESASCQAAKADPTHPHEAPTSALFSRRTR